MIWLEFSCAAWIDSGSRPSSPDGGISQYRLGRDDLENERNKTGTIAETMLYVDNGGIGETGPDPRGVPAYRSCDVVATVGGLRPNVRPAR